MQQAGRFLALIKACRMDKAKSDGSMPGPEQVLNQSIKLNQSNISDCHTAALHQSEFSCKGSG